MGKFCLAQDSTSSQRGTFKIGKNINSCMLYIDGMKAESVVTNDFVSSANADTILKYTVLCSISKKDLLKAKKVQVTGCGDSARIISFSILAGMVVYISRDENFTPEMISWLKKLHKGSGFLIENIICANQFGEVKHIPNRDITIH